MAYRMRRWSNIETKDALEKRYRALIPTIREVARKSGYAVGVHGSLRRDLDIIAAPWTDTAVKPITLVMRIQAAVAREPMRKKKKDMLRNKWKPHGREAYVIILGTLGNRFVKAKKGIAYVDLSVLPRRPRRK